MDIDAIKERLELPIIGSAVITFAILNWKIYLIATTGDLYYSVKMDLISKYLGEHKIFFLWALLTGLVLHIIYPVLIFIKHFFIQQAQNAQNIATSFAEKWSPHYKNQLQIHKNNVLELRDKMANMQNIINSKDNELMQLKNLRYNIITFRAEISNMVSDIKCINDNFGKNKQRANISSAESRLRNINEKINLITIPEEI